MTKNNSSFTSEDLLPRLRGEYGYSESGSVLIANKLVACGDLIKSAFWNWWQTGVCDGSLKYGDYSMSQLINDHGMKPIAAFITLDSIEKNPDKDRMSLKRGHDRVITDRN